MPAPTMTTAIAAVTRPAMRRPRRETGGVEGSGDMRFSDGGGRRRAAAVVTVRDAEDDGNEHQGGQGCESQPADDRATEGRVLLAAFPEPQRHRRHADDHG